MAKYMSKKNTVIEYFVVYLYNTRKFLSTNYTNLHEVNAFEQQILNDVYIVNYTNQCAKRVRTSELYLIRVNSCN